MSRSYRKSVDMEKPRRLEEETAVYLSGLESQLNSPESENVEILIDNVLEEIKHRTASAASDRYANFVLEKICALASLNQLVEVLDRCIPYVLFLSQNRHSSHVLQSVLSRICHLLKMSETHDVDLEKLEKTILNFAEPILENFRWLAGDISGSHVLRSVICLLAGIPCISERKGNSSKHQHSVALSVPLDKILLPDLYYVNTAECFQVPDSFHSTLHDSLKKSLVCKKENVECIREIQMMISDASCCAAVAIILRILYNPYLIDGGVELASQIVNCALEWNKSEDFGMDDIGANCFYAMGGDRSGSYFLEAVIECCTSQYLIDLVQRSLLYRSDETIREFVEDNVANFIIQSVLKRIVSIINCARVSESSLPQRDELLDLSKKLLSSLLEPSLFSYMVKCKGGVVLWMIKLENAMDHIDKDAASKLLIEWTGCENNRAFEDIINSDEFKSKLDQYVVRIFDTPASPETSDANLEKNKKDNSKNKPSAASLLVARLLGAILSCDGSHAADSVCKMLCRLPHSVVLSISCSGPISRSMLDVFFESKRNVRERSTFLTGQILPNIEVFSTHAIAHHILRKCFEHASSIDKERIVEAVISPSLYQTLTHSREGKAVMRFTQCDLYSRNISEWKALIVRQKKAQSMLDELESVSKHQSTGAQDSCHNISKETHNDNSIGDVEDSASCPSGGNTNLASRKRKRKRTSSKPAVEKSSNEDTINSDNAIDEIFKQGDASVNTASSAAEVQATKETKKNKKAKRESSHGSRKSKHANDGRADMHKVKLLNSGKMMSIKKLTESL